MTETDKRAKKAELIVVIDRLIVLLENQARDAGFIELIKGGWRHWVRARVQEL